MAIVDFSVNPSEIIIDAIMVELDLTDRREAVRIFQRDREEERDFRMFRLSEALDDMVHPQRGRRTGRRLCGECLCFHAEQITCNELQELIWADRQIGSLWDLV